MVAPTAIYPIIALRSVQNDGVNLAVDALRLSILLDSSFQRKQESIISHAARHSYEGRNPDEICRV